MITNDKVYFEDISHSYFLENGKSLIGVTTLLKKHGLSVNYDNIPADVLEKAAARGSFIHATIDSYCKGEKVESTEELKAFKKLKLKVLASEYLVSDNEVVASSIDIVLADYSLADIKTTSTLHTDTLSWQLSIYAYLFELQNPELKVPALYGIHIRDGKATKVEISRIESSIVEELINCEREGRIFSNVPAPVEQSEEIKQLYDIEQFIISIEEKAKQAKENREKLLANLYSQMEQNNLKKIDNDLMTITRILPSKRISVDNKKLQTEHPDIYNSVIKEFNIKGSVRITLK